MEKIILNKVESSLQTSVYQSGGKKGMSTSDNWIILMAIMDNNRRLKKNTYILMVDAEKCFDKLWLQDCLIDMRDAGMREKEIKLIYEMNKEARIVVDTPAGLTKEVRVEKIVKQETVFGPV